MNQLIKLFFFVFIFTFIVACSSNYALQTGMISFKAEDYRRAFITLKPLAHKNIPDAEYAIGYMYYYGQGVIEDKKRGRMWIARAASHGEPRAITAMTVLNQDKQSE
jgi:TPR repeat protein